MINILVAFDDIDSSIDIMNFINSNSKDMRVSIIAKNSQELLKLLNNKNDIDIILVDYDIIFFREKEILNDIVFKNQYFQTIILLANNENNLNKIKNKEMLYSIVSKNDGIIEIIDKINDLIRNKELKSFDTVYDKKIIKELLYLGYDISHKGTQYLIKVIKYLLLNPYKNVDNFEKVVYPKIAELYDDSVHNIKCRINTSTTIMYYNCENEKLKKYFNLDIDIKPKVKTVANTILNKIL